MYSEQQFYRNPWARWLQIACATLAVLQLCALAGAEMGMLRLPFGYAVHWGISLIMGLCVGLLSHIGLTFRINATGLALRFFPYQWQFQRVPWNEIRQIRLLPGGEYPAGALFGRPTRDFSQACWLTHPAYQVLCVTLINGVPLYISTERPQELLDFLQHGLALQSGKVRIGQW